MMRALAFLLAAALLAPGCARSGDAEARGDGVVAAIYPLAFVVERLAGDDFAVTDLTPAGAEPHDVELTPRQVATLSDAELTVLIGSGFQPSVEDALDAGQGETLDVLTSIGADVVAGDPHVWLDPLIMADIADAIADEVARLDLASEEELTRNADALRSELEELDRSFAESLRRLFLPGSPKP